MRALAGVNLPHNSFINAEVAERVLSGGCTDQRAEFTAGIHAGRHWMGLAQVFVDGPQYGDETVKAQLSLGISTIAAAASNSAFVIASTAAKTNWRWCFRSGLNPVGRAAGIANAISAQSPPSCKR